MVSLRIYFVQIIVYILFRFHVRQAGISPSVMVMMTLRLSRGLPVVSISVTIKIFVQISCYTSRDISDGDDDFEIVTHRARSIKHHRLCEIPASCLIDHLL